MPDETMPQIASKFAPQAHLTKSLDRAAARWTQGELSSGDFAQALWDLRFQSRSIARASATAQAREFSKLLDAIDVYADAILLSAADQNPTESQRRSCIEEAFSRNAVSQTSR